MTRRSLMNVKNPDTHTITSKGVPHGFAQAASGDAKLPARPIMPPAAAYRFRLPAC